VDELQWLTHSLFADRVSENFEVREESVAPVTLTLVETAESDAAGGTGPDGVTRQQFSLVFRGPLEPVLPQQIHRLEHADLGVLTLFLVPLGPDSTGMRYEAAFG
jgi:hypothetical protein